MVELVHADRSPEELAQEFEPSAQSIRSGFRVYVAEQKFQQFIVTPSSAREGFRDWRMWLPTGCQRSVY